MHISSESPQLLLDAEFNDIEHLCDTVKLWDLDLRPITSQLLTSNAGRLIQIAAGPLSYGFCSLGANFDQYGASPPGMFTFVVMEPKVKSLWWNGADHPSDQVLVYRPGDEMRSVNDAGFEIQTISVKPEFLAGMCDRLEIGAEKFDDLPQSFAMPSSVLLQVRQQLCAFRTQTCYKTWHDLEETLELLVGFWVTSVGLVPSKRRPPRARDKALHKCFEFFETWNTMDVSLSQLSAATNVSQRTLIYAFRERFGLSPKTFLKARQLSEARHRLKARTYSNLQIGEIAGDLGFFHHGHFTSDYKLHFGETPTETRRRFPR